MRVEVKVEAKSLRQQEAHDHQPYLASPKNRLASHHLNFLHPTSYLHRSGIRSFIPFNGTLELIHTTSTSGTQKMEVTNRVPHVIRVTPRLVGNVDGVVLRRPRII